MIPEEVFKRRHFGTPEAISLIVTNYIVVVVAIEIFADCQQINWFFWVILGLLAAYNFYKVRLNPEIFTKKNLIVHGISIVLLLVVFFLLRYKAQPC